MARFKALEPSNLWHRFCAMILYPLTRVLGKRQYVGMEKLNRPGAMLLVGNHISHLDPMYDVVMIHQAGRIPHVLAKAGLFRIPFVGKALYGTGQIPVERGSGAGQAALDPAKQVLADGGVVLIYPEGTVTREPNFWPMRPRPGVAALALAGNFRVVPIVHWGTQKVYNSYATEGTRKLKLFPRQDVKVVVGDDIDLSEFRGREVDARAIRDVSLKVMGELASMLAEVRGEQAPAQLFDPKKAARLQGSTGTTERPAAAATDGDGS